MEEETANIFSLPNEIIIYILDYTSYIDLNRFGMTCKKFNEIVKTTQCIWKTKYKKMVHRSIFVNVDGPTVNWNHELKKHVILKNKIHIYLTSMSLMHYNNLNEISIKDVKQFFEVALVDETSYGQTIYILQDFIRKGNCYLNNNVLIYPYSFTTVYYAKMVLRYIFQIYLAFIWGKCHLQHKQNPIEVLNFFVQWVDPLNIHSQKEVDALLNRFKELIKKEIKRNNPAKYKEEARSENGIVSKFTDDEVTTTTSTVIYKQRFIKLMPHTTLDTLDIKKVFKTHCGSMISIGAIYQHVAEHFGVNCTLVAFPNHFILELEKPQVDPNNPLEIYKISLDSGEIRPKGRCPFTHRFFPDMRNVYCPLSLAQYISHEFLSSMGEVRNWYTKNIELLLDFLNGDNDDTPYRNILKFIMSHRTTPALQYYVNYFHLCSEQITFLLMLSSIDRAPSIRRRSITVKTRDGNLKYAVGMICYHKQYNYVCLIRRWDVTCSDTRFNPAEIRTLEFGIRQPFYHVLAMDQSERYVPQENLVEYGRPTRLYHLEDIIAKEFAYFNGFSYVPNDEKAAEYPEDTAISELFKSQFSMRNNSNQE